MMPYSAPLNVASNIWTSPTIISGNLKNQTDMDVIAKKLLDDETKKLKEILSTSPQLATSPRRKSDPPSYSRKSTLTVDLPSLLPPFTSVLRKKSGEVVKSSLKSKSEPATPTFPKYVHFNADLEEVRLFNEAQRPKSVSADVSSDEDSDDDELGRYSLPVSDDEEEEDDGEAELVATLPNRPMITTMHSSKLVFVESVFLSQDKRALQGRVLVQNIAFQKSVQVRYTFDFWSTVSEVSATYAEGVPSKDNKNSFDVFVFSIELIDNSRNPIDGKTMYFAVHYTVENNDFWDNNNGQNYQVNFRMEKSPSKPKRRSKVQNNNNSSNWSMTYQRQTNQNLSESIAHSPPASSPKFNSIAAVAADSRKKLVGRYDIGVSLSAAQNAPRPVISTQSDDTFTRSFQSYFPQVSSYNYYDSDNYQAFFPNNFVDGMPGTTTDFELNQNSNPTTISSSKPAIGSSSYYELVNQYCFYPSPSCATDSSIY